MPRRASRRESNSTLTNSNNMDLENVMEIERMNQALVQQAISITENLPPRMPKFRSSVSRKRN